MVRPNALAAWENLLGEPIEVMAKGRVDTAAPGRNGSFKKGTVFLTPARFIYIQSARPFSPPSLKNKHSGPSSFQFQRGNITGLTVVSSRKRRELLSVRYFDETKMAGEEHKIRLLLGTDSASLIKLLEQDLAGV